MLLTKIVGLAMLQRAMCEAANVETQPGFTVSVCKEESCTKRHGASSSEVMLRGWDPPEEFAHQSRHRRERGDSSLTVILVT